MSSTTNDTELLNIKISRSDLIFLDNMLRRVLVTTPNRAERLRLAGITKQMLYTYAPHTRPCKPYQCPNL